jgi:hypothetical protein
MPPVRRFPALSPCLSLTSYRGGDKPAIPSLADMPKFQIEHRLERCITTQASRDRVAPATGQRDPVPGLTRHRDIKLNNRMPLRK